MNDEKIIKICDKIFTKEIKKAKLELNQFKTGLYERELYWEAIRSFKKGFMKQLKHRLSKPQTNKKSEGDIK